MNSYIAGLDENGRFSIPIEIRHKNNIYTTEVYFKLDTGADRSTITLEDLEALGYSTEDVKALMKRDGSGSGAYGSPAKWFSIDLRVNHIMGQIIPKGTKFPFLCSTQSVVDKPEFCRTGCNLTGEIIKHFRSSLMGRDILSCFTLASSSDNKQMIFTRIKDLKERNRNFPHCEVLELTSDPIKVGYKEYLFKIVNIRGKVELTNDAINGLRLDSISLTNPDTVKYLHQLVDEDRLIRKVSEKPNGRLQIMYYVNK